MKKSPSSSLSSRDQRVASPDYEAGVRAFFDGDFATGLRMLLPLAEGGSAKAQFTLGFMYEDGVGVPQDYKQARSWYLKAAKQGYTDAQHSLGSMYEYGKGVPQDYKQAARWYLKAAKQGDTTTQILLGWMYYVGKGVPQDYKRAARWCSKAAKVGVAEARSYLNMIYGSDQGGGDLSLKGTDSHRQPASRRTPLLH